MGNTETKPKASIMAANPNKSPEQAQLESPVGYASGLRSDILGKAPPAATTSGPRAKPMPDYFSGRDSLERAREQFRYERDMARYNRTNDVAPCSVACNHEFSKCRTGCDSSILYNADLFETGTDQCAPQQIRSAYTKESEILAKQLMNRNASLKNTRNGSMYNGAQQNVHGKDSLARRPVASVAIEESVNRGNSNINSLKPETNRTRLALADNQKRQELELNKLGSQDA